MKDINELYSLVSTGSLSEKEALDILEKIEEYRHNGDHEAKNSLIVAAYNEHPYDFRIIDWYIVTLLDFADVSKNKKEIEEYKDKKESEIEEIRVKLLGKKGEITQLFDEFRNVLPEQKREFGQKLNQLKNAAAQKIEELKNMAAEKM